MVNTKIRFIILFAAKDGEALYRKWKEDWELSCGSDHEHFTAQFKWKKPLVYSVLFSSVAQLCPALLWSHEPQHTRQPCLSPTPGVHPHPCPLSQWCHPTISSSAVPFSSRSQSFPASGSFPMSQLFPSGGQSIGVSASTSVLPVNTQDWSPLGWADWISLQSKGLSRVFSNTTLQSINSPALSFLYSSTLTSIHDQWKNHSLD